MDAVLAELPDRVQLTKSCGWAAPGNLPGVRVHHQAAGSIGIDPLQRVDDPASDHDPVFAHLNI